jgi:hypothetical protein
MEQFATYCSWSGEVLFLCKCSLIMTLLNAILKYYLILIMLIIAVDHSFHVILHSTQLLKDSHDICCMKQCISQQSFYMHCELKRSIIEDLTHKSASLLICLFIMTFSDILLSPNICNYHHLHLRCCLLIENGMHLVVMK